MNKLSTLALFVLAPLLVNACSPRAFPVCEPPPPKAPSDYACESASRTAAWPENVKEVQSGLAWSFHLSKVAFSLLPSDIQQQHKAEYESLYQKVIDLDEIFVNGVDAAIAAGNSDWGRALADVATAVQKIIDFVHGLEGNARARLQAGADDGKLEEARAALASAQHRLDEVKAR